MAQAAPGDTAALMATVRVLAADSMEGRRAGTPGGARARAWLVERLRQLGLTPLLPGYLQRFPLPRDEPNVGTNILAVIPGTEYPRRYLVLSAHYDHVGVVNGETFNGADDNASGVAAVLALAAGFKAQPLRHSLVIALFDAEESGIMGARAFTAGQPVPRDSIRLNVNLDMVGHNAAGELWAAGASRHPALRPVLEEVAARAPVRLRLGHDRPGVAGEADWTFDSDHAAFHNLGIPFVYFGEEDHPDYHRPSDDPETLTPAFFGRAVSTIQDAVRALDARLATTSGRGGTSR
jgi:Zn-dependent M28 family amino/carboxypeptidase